MTEQNAQSSSRYACRHGVASGGCEACMAHMFPAEGGAALTWAEESLPAWSGRTPLWKLFEDDDVAFTALVKMACPAPCLGHRVPSGEDWHAVCERKALVALDALRGPLA